MANNSYDIFQLKNDDSTRELRFEGLRRLAKMGAKVRRENYDLSMMESSTPMVSLLIRTG